MLYEVDGVKIRGRLGNIVSTLCVVPAGGIHMDSSLPIPQSIRLARKDLSPYIPV